MLITQTPLRISFFGGGTDLPAYYRKHGGVVLSTTIDKYIYVIAKQRYDEKIRVGYTRTELVDSVDEVQHDLIREALRMTGWNSGIEIDTMADIPSTGSGLGSSSAVTVGTLLALHALKGQNVSAEQLAAQACQIEIERLGRPIGRQDQYGVAYGGLNLIEFHPGNNVTVFRLNSIPGLQDNLMLFYTGIARKAESVLSDQASRLQENAGVMESIKYLAYVAYEKLLRGEVHTFGTLLHQAWLFKQQLSPKISNSRINAMYGTALNAGALGGKLCGAGGGGFLLLYVPRENQNKVRDAMIGEWELLFRFENGGAQIIFRKD